RYRWICFKLQNVAGSATLTLNVRVLDSPGPPSNITVKDVTKNSATVTWDIPENEGGGPVNNYLIDIREISRKGWTRLTDKCRRLSYKVSDLEEGGIYFFRVTGENEYGIGVSAETKEGTKMTGHFSVGRSFSDLVMEVQVGRFHSSPTHRGHPHLK
uniref:Fibronectin type-III domain-containing protein n=1 Tax=Fundulus heteroclitus TaxID=8078 RepID=A0A3Q2P6Z6_FUNHE